MLELGRARLTLSHLHWFLRHFALFLVILVNFFPMDPCLHPWMRRTPLVSCRQEEPKEKGAALCVREQQECMEFHPGVDREPVSGLEGKLTWVT